MSPELFSQYLAAARAAGCEEFSVSDGDSSCDVKFGPLPSEDREPIASDPEEDELERLADEWRRRDREP